MTDLAQPTVLVIDDDLHMRDLVVSFLTKAGMATLTAVDGSSGLELARTRADIDAIVLDIMMPGMDGYGVLRELKAVEATRPIPVILLTAHANDEPDVLRSFEGGAVDHVSKPFRGRVLAAKVLATCLRYRAQSDMRERAQQAEALAQTDPLTGLPNRRAFDLALERAGAGVTASSAPCALLMVDVDHFKSVNDTFGHESGDRVLQWLAERLAEAKGECFRFGGEEFCCILPGVDRAGAERAARALLQSVRAERCTLPDGKLLGVTVSIGVALADAENDFDLGDLLARADAALYGAKESGRDCHVIESL